MAIWSLTKGELQRAIETTVRNVRGDKAGVTANDRFVIFTSINEALVDISLERGMNAPTPITSDTTAATVANQNYVDLADAVINVVDGTVRIVAEDVILTRFNGAIKDFYAYDPGEDFSGTHPTLYCLDQDGSGGFRMRLRPTPGAVYTIAMKVETMPEEDIVGDFPGWYHGALRSKATSIALEALGLPVGSHEQRYEKRIRNIDDKMRGFDGPVHMSLGRRRVRETPAELRISS